MNEVGKLVHVPMANVNEVAELVHVPMANVNEVAELVHVPMANVNRVAEPVQVPMAHATCLSLRAFASSREIDVTRRREVGRIYGSASGQVAAPIV